MKPSAFIASVMSKIDLPKRKLEDYANRYGKNNRRRSADQLELDGFENISWRFLNTTASGSVELVFARNRDKGIICIDIPASTGFLAACTKGDYGNFELTFAISLS